MYLKKALSGEEELTKADVVFENTVLETVANPKLTAMQKAGQLRYLKELANSLYQREMAEAYSTFAEAMLTKDNINETVGVAEEWANRMMKVHTLLLSAVTLLKVAEQKRLNQK